MTWQPIDTAPKDGTIVRLYGLCAGEISGIRDHPEQCDGYFSRGTTDYEGFNWNVCGGDAYSVWCKPTHWMPLTPNPIG